MAKPGPKPHRTIEEKREAARKRVAHYRQRHPEKARGSVRRSKKKRLAAKAVAEGRMPGRVGNPKRQTQEERRAYLAQWRAENAEKLRAQDAVRKLRYTRVRAARNGRTLRVVRKFASHEERVRERRRLCVVYANRRRALKVAAGGSYSADDVQRLYQLQRGKCVFCLLPLTNSRFEVDHHMPLIRGGTNDFGNLRLLHRKCNRSKGGRDPAEHALRNGLLCW